MPFPSKTIVGMIAVLPDPAAGGGRSRIADDATLGGLLASLAHCASLEASCGQPASFVAATRVSRLAPEDLAPYATIRADLARLTDDLAEEYELVCGR
jgi:hypothetical protein